MSRSRARNSKNLAKWYIEYSVYRTVEFLFSLVPLKTVCALGEDTGRLAFHLTKKYRRLVYKNLCIVSPDTTEKERWVLTKKVFERNGANLFASVKTATMPLDEIKECVTLTNLDLLSNKLESGKGVVLLLAHMGNWELLAQLPGVINLSYQFGTYYRPLNNPYTNQLIEHRRKRAGTHLFAKKASVHKITEFLRNAGTIGFLADQRVGRSGKKVPFFGKEVTCSSLPAILAKRSDSAVLAMSMQTVATGHWAIEFFDPKLTTPDTGQCMLALEEAMKNSLTDCFWFQDRWK